MVNIYNSGNTLFLKICCVLCDVRLCWNFSNNFGLHRTQQSRSIFGQFGMFWSSWCKSTSVSCTSCHLQEDVAVTLLDPSDVCGTRARPACWTRIFSQISFCSEHKVREDVTVLALVSLTRNVLKPNLICTHSCSGWTAFFVFNGNITFVRTA